MMLLKLVPVPTKPADDGREHRLSKYFEDHVEEGRGAQLSSSATRFGP